MRLARIAALTALWAALPAWGQVASSQPVSAPHSQPATSPADDFAQLGSTPLSYGGEGSGSAKEPRSREDGNPLWQMLASVLVVLALGGLTLFVLKRLGPRMGVTMRGKGKQVQLLETTYLGQRKTVHLVRVGSQKFLLGGGPGGVTLLAEIKDESQSQENG